MSKLNEFLRERLRTEHVQHLSNVESPPWCQEGVTVEIDEAIYYEHLEMLPPRYMSGDLFAFGEGAGHFVLFWMRSQRHFAHQLSLEDTTTFCQLSVVLLNQ